MPNEDKAVLNKYGIATTPGYITIYNYVAETGEFLEASDEYLQEGVGIPAHSTLLPKPLTERGQVAIFDIDQKSWLVVEDHRGDIVYSKDSGEALEINTIGPIPDSYTDVKPLHEYDSWNGKKWVIDINKKNELAIKEAEIKKKTLLSVATSECNEMMVDFNLGLLSDEQIAVLKQWRVYINKLKEIKTTTPDDIEWPIPPAL
ncbi:tail fiber assembly protein [Salmonella enterica]|nr:tail fiber assembly protein [Salmonella enterica]